MDDNDPFQQAAISAFLPELDENSRELTRWLHQVVGPRYDRMKADPSRSIPAGGVSANLEARHTTRR